ncbi:MAG: RNA polymerase sigma factor [Colwellia sp.]|nr:RNA polymerase sigma factor [Colwellia sp.]
MKNNVNENELIVKVLIGNDQQAFSQLVKHHQQSVRQYCRRLCAPDLSLADDIAQNTFLQAFRKLNLYQERGKEHGRGKFISWLLSIAYYQFLQHLRAKKTYHELDEQQLTPCNSEQLNHEIDLEAAMTLLSANERSCLTLQYTFGYSQSEISEMLKIPLGTIKSHSKRGKDKLSFLLNAKTGDNQDSNPIITGAA